MAKIIDLKDEFLSRAYENLKNNASTLEMDLLERKINDHLFYLLYADGYIVRFDSTDTPCIVRVLETKGNVKDDPIVIATSMFEEIKREIDQSDVHSAINFKNITYGRTVIDYDVDAPRVFLIHYWLKNRRRK